MNKVTGMSKADTANAFNRAMTERKNDGHTFQDFGVKGMETICGKCYQAH